MTNVDGQFMLRAPRAGRYRLEAEQIGYQTAVSPIFTLGADTLTYTFTIEIRPVKLPGIEVATRERGCRRRPDGGNVAVLWSEIRKALAATAWSEQFGQIVYTNHVYRTLISPDRLHLLEETGSTFTARSRSPFSVASPTALAAHGFSRRDSVDLILLGPDAAVLTSDEFLDGHCFSLAVDARLPNMVGLAFEPIRRRRDFTDIRGTLWVDRQSAALQNLVYSYLSLPDPFADYGADGEVEFLRLPNGLWIVRSWRIRSPFLELGYLFHRNKTRRSGIIEDGGLVLQAVEDTGTQYAFTGDGVVEGRVLSDRGWPLPGAHVLITGTGFFAETDSAGRYRITDVPSGRFGLTFSHQLTKDLSISVALDSVEISADTARRDLGLPQLDQVQRRVCANTIKDHPAPGMVYGIVTNAEERSIFGAETRASWMESAAPETAKAQRGERTDSHGRYYICGLPLDVPLTVQVRVGHELKQLVTRIPPAGVPVIRLDFWRP